jgi:hypothetical protein
MMDPHFNEIFEMFWKFVKKTNQSSLASRTAAQFSEEQTFGKGIDTTKPTAGMNPGEEA